MKSDQRSHERSGESKDPAVDSIVSEDCFRNLLDYLPGISIQGYSTDGTVRYWNKASKQVYGYGAEEAIGRNLGDLIIPDDLLPLFHQALEVGKQATESGELMPAGEVVLKRKDGSRVPVFSIHTVVCMPGRDNLMFCIDVDLSERKRMEEQLRGSEERLRTLFDNVPVGLYRTTPGGKVLMANPAMVEMLGYDSLEDLQSIGDVTCRYKNPEDRGEFLELIEERGKVDGLETTWLKKDGTPLEIEEAARAVRAPDGTVMFFEGIVRDITMKKQLERELVKASKLESIGLFAGGIAHDFNNMLGALAINLWSARRSSGDTVELLGLLNDSERIIQRAQQITGQLFTFSKVSPPVKKTIDVREILRDAVSLSLGGSRIKCELEICDDPAPVEVDEGQMSQVFSNLLINAGQAMPGGGVVTVRVENRKIDTTGRYSLPPGDYVCISVMDQGQGISGEHLPRIFDPYYTTKKKGSGLGLTTSYSIVSGHGGSITAETNKPRGAVFHVILPAARGTSTASGRSKRPVVDLGDEKFRILIMDDEEDYRNSLQRVLSGLGHQVEVAGDGSEALQAYRDREEAGREFDVVIMDLTIAGGMGGRQAISELKQRHPSARAIVSSGYCDDPVVKEFGRFGFDGVMTKPFAVEDLVREMKRVLEEAQQS